MKNPKRISKYARTLRTERTLAVFAIATIVIAWFVGSARAEADVVPFLKQAYPGAHYFQPETNAVYSAYEKEGGGLLGYVGIDSAIGYGGPLKVAVGIDLAGNLVNLAVVETKETASWMDRIYESNLFEQLIGKTYTDQFSLDQDIDIISGATYTTRAIVESTRNSIREVAGKELGLEVPEEAPERIVFGVPEITLLGLFAIGFFGHQRKSKYSKQLRWISMLIGLVVLGFMYNSPLTIAFINKLLIGYFPSWRTNLYWYLLLGGILLVYTVDNKNPYCEWFCPFGAAQECFGVIGGAKVRTPSKYRMLFKWIQRGLAWFAIIVALIFRSPGLSSYEVFGTLFDLIGSPLQFAILGIILIAAIFMRRPWCSYLCPLGPVTDFIRMSRKWVIEKWKLQKQEKTA